MRDAATERAKRSVPKNLRCFYQLIRKFKRKDTVSAKTAITKRSSPDKSRFFLVHSYNPWRKAGHTRYKRFTAALARALLPE